MTAFGRDLITSAREALATAERCPLTVEPLPAEDGGGFIAYAPDLPGCMSDGETEAEARENGRSAVRDWLDEARRLGRRIPEPPGQ